MCFFEEKTGKTNTYSEHAVRLHAQEPAHERPKFGQRHVKTEKKINDEENGKRKVNLGSKKHASATHPLVIL